MDEFEFDFSESSIQAGIEEFLKLNTPDFEQTVFHYPLNSLPVAVFE